MPIELGGRWMDGFHGPGAAVRCGNSHVQLPFLPGARYDQFAPVCQAFLVPQAGSHEMGVVHPAWRSMPVSSPLTAPVFLSGILYRFPLWIRTLPGNSCDQQIRSLLPDSYDPAAHVRLASRCTGGVTHCTKYMLSMQSALWNINMKSPAGRGFFRIPRGGGGSQ